MPAAGGNGYTGPLFPLPNSSIANAITPISVEQPTYGVRAYYWEGVSTVVPISSAFASLGPIQLNNSIDRLFAQINVPTPTGSGALPSGGMQVQILAKATVNAPWMTIWSWATLQSFVAANPNGTPPLYVFAPGQSGLVLPVNSNTAFDMDVRGIYAIDFQVSGTSSATAPVTAQIFAGANVP